MQPGGGRKMKRIRRHWLFRTLALFLAALTVNTGVPVAWAASHREAPLIALDPAADNTDTYAFRSYEPGRSDSVVFILNVNPGQDPSDGPNYFNFDDRVLYRIQIDNDMDGVAEDVAYEFRFKTETRPALGSLNFPLPYVGNPHIPVPQLQGITSLDGDGSEGLTRRQTYMVTEVRGKKRTRLFQGQTRVAVPSNVGPATMPRYEELAAQGIYTDTHTGIRVFAGQRAETFYIDLGAVFDTANLRRFPPLLTTAEDADDNSNPFGVNRFTGTNISTIAIEVPITRITRDHQPPDKTKTPIIGMYASTSRPRVTLLKGGHQWREDDDDSENGHGGDRGRFVQVSRMANPLVNELIIDTPFKDRWNASEPEDEARFQEFYKNPSLAQALFLIFGVGVPATPRTDLMSALLKYPGQSLDGNDCGSPCAELLRLDLRVPPAAPENQERLGPFAHNSSGLATPDPAGWPNGRRPNDDVTDIALRVLGGPNYAAAMAGDGVNFLQGAQGSNLTANGIYKVFPFLPTPYDGRQRRHIDCGEPGANPCGPPVS
jgi:Domain of unknown function (DUF4331)